MMKTLKQNYNMTKEECIDSFTNHVSYIGSIIKERIAKIDINIKNKPTRLRRGDVIKIPVGQKVRPSVIVYVEKDFVISIPLTSSENIHSTIKFKSRFFGENYFTNEYKVTLMEIAMDNFIGVFDNDLAINQGIKNLKNFILNRI